MERKDRKLDETELKKVTGGTDSIDAKRPGEGGGGGSRDTGDDTGNTGGESVFGQG